VADLNLINYFEIWNWPVVDFFASTVSLVKCRCQYDQYFCCRNIICCRSSDISKALSC